MPRTTRTLLMGAFVILVFQTFCPAQGFDGGLRSGSAIGQLQEISGGRINVPAIRGGGGGGGFGSMGGANPMMQMGAGMLFNIFMDQAFADNSAELERERIAAEQRAAELRRIAEEQRLARVRMAVQLRSSWDQQDAELSSLLEGIFSPGTPFFGSPANPDAQAVARSLLEDAELLNPRSADMGDIPDVDGSVVDLRGISSPIVQMPAISGAPPAPFVAPMPAPVHSAPAPMPVTPRQLGGWTDVDEWSRWFPGWWRDQARQIAEDFLWQPFRRVPGYSGARYLRSQYQQWQELNEFMSSQSNQTLDLAFAGMQGAARDLGSLNGNSFDFQAYDASVYRRFEEWQEGARNLVRSQVMSNTFKPDAEAWMDQPLEAGRVVPIRDTISSLGYRPWQFQHYSQWP